MYFIQWLQLFKVSPVFFLNTMLETAKSSISGNQLFIKKKLLFSYWLDERVAIAQYLLLSLLCLWAPLRANQLAQEQTLLPSMVKKMRSSQIISKELEDCKCSVLYEVSPGNESNISPVTSCCSAALEVCSRVQYVAQGG